MKKKNRNPCSAQSNVAPEDSTDVGLKYAHAVMASEVSAYRVLAACEHSDITKKIDIPCLLTLIKERNAAFSKGEIRSVEQMLSAQAVALQALFVRLTERAMEQSHMPNMEGFMRLALRSQSQCRATLETLAALKNPPVLIARQANLTTGSQQINNGGVMGERHENNTIAQNKLLERNSVKWMDAGAPGKTGAADKDLASMGRIYRPQNHGREASITE